MDTARRPEGCDRIALVLQGGGALGAYQAGAYQAMHEAGLEPDWVAGVSIGGINAAIIAGNPPQRRVERLRQFWETITARPVWPVQPDNDLGRKLYSAWSSLLTTIFGQPGFFTPYQPGPWLTPPGVPGATSFYDSEPLRALLLELVDFDQLNRGDIRYAAGSVQVATGNFAYFDNAKTVIRPEHVMASGALPPGLPMVQVDQEFYWDGGVVSNTPLQHLLDNAGSKNTLVFQVDLFSARGPVPRDMLDVLNRQKDIQYSSRTRLVTDVYLHMHRQNQMLHALLEKLPDSALDSRQRALKRRLANLPEITILHLIYQQAAYEGVAKDYDFSATSMRAHWDNGYRDARDTLRHENWLTMARGGHGIVTHDVHRAD